MRFETKLRVIKRLLRGDEFLLIFTHRTGETSFDGGSIGSTEQNLTFKVLCEMIEHNEGIRKFILDGAKDYLTRYEVDGRNFAKDILTK